MFTMSSISVHSNGTKIIYILRSLNTVSQNKTGIKVLLLCDTGVKMFKLSDSSITSGKSPHHTLSAIKVVNEKVFFFETKLYNPALHSFLCTFHKSHQLWE